MMKRITALLMLGVMALSLCACTAQPTAQDTDTQPMVTQVKLDPAYSTTITVCGPWGNFEALDPAAQLFNKQYPNITVVYNQLGDYGSDLRNRFVSGEGVDLYTCDWFLSSDSRYASYWTNAEDLTGVLDFSAIPEAYLATGAVQGKQAAVPIYTHTYGLMVNEDLLAHYNLAVPQTFDTFLSCCDTLRAAGVYPMLEANRDYMIQGCFNMLYADVMRRMNWDQLAQDFLNGHDLEGLMDYILAMLDVFYGKDYMHPDSDTLADDYNAAILRFSEGDIAFMPYTTSSYSGTKKREAKSESFTAKPFRYSLVPFPGMNGPVSTVQQLGSVYMMVYQGVEAEKLPYVHAFLQFLMDDTGSETLMRVKNMPTANKNVGYNMFPAFKDLKEGQACFIGADRESELMLKVNQLMRAASRCYEIGITAQTLLNTAVSNVNGQ